MPVQYKPKLNALLSAVGINPTLDPTSMAGPMSAPMAVGMTAARGWLMPGKGLMPLGSDALHGTGAALNNMFNRGAIRKAAQGQYQGRLNPASLSAIEKDLMENLSAMPSGGKVILEAFPSGASNYFHVPLSDIIERGLGNTLLRMGKKF